MNEFALEQFKSHGYTHLRGVLDPADIAALDVEYGRVLDGRSAAWRGAGQIAGGDEFVGQGFLDQLTALSALPSFDLALLNGFEATLPYAPFSIVRPDSQMYVGQALLELLHRIAALEEVAALLGTEILASPNQHCRIKPPEAINPGAAGPTSTNYAATGWHQDAVTHIEESVDTPVLTCWVPMCDVDEERGCMLVAPGDEFAESALLPWPIPEPTMASLNARAIPLPAQIGDVLLFDKRLPHASLPNRSGRVRWSFDLRLYPASMPGDRPWYPSVCVRSDSDPASVVRSATTWRGMWERARAMMVESNRIVPGRPAHAEMIAHALIAEWAAGSYPRLS